MNQKDYSLLSKIIFFLLSFLVMAGYLLPVHFHAKYISDRILYEYDSITKDDFEVYTTSLFGKKDKIKDFSLSNDTVTHNGKVTLATGDRFEHAVVDLHSVPVSSSDVYYNPTCYEDQIEDYEPDVSETITYENGRTETLYSENLDIHVEINSIDKTMMINVIGKNGTYCKEFPLTTIVSMTTDTKVSTDKELSSDQLKLTVNYSDGSSSTASNDDVSSNKITDPDDGSNQLQCFYNEENHIVEVVAYTPKPTVTFDNYGTFTLEYSKTYEVKGAHRLNTSNGKIHFNDHYETYYSQRVLPGTALNIPGRHVAKDGTIRDKDGYICVASDYSFKNKHTVLLTSLGPAKVYDCGCAYGIIDLYVDW